MGVAGVALSLCVAGFAATKSPSAKPAASADTKKTESAASKTTAAALSAKDKTFMQDAAKGGMEEDGTDPDVKKFAEKGAKMVQKHLKLAQDTQSKLK